MITRMGRLFSMMCFGLVLLGPSPAARADEAADKARMHNTNARTLFNVGKFEQAAA
jgi:hypothetical protein